MRNKFPGRCYRCGNMVEIGQGHFEKYSGGWRTQHATCCIEARTERGFDSPAEEKVAGSYRRKEAAKVRKKQ